MIFSLEKFDRESGDKLSEEERAKLKADVEEAKGHLNSENTEELKEALEKLKNESAAIFTKMYQQAQANGQNNEGPAEYTTDDTQPQ